jgi:hypothetical protein
MWYLWHGDRFFLIVLPSSSVAVIPAMSLNRLHLQNYINKHTKRSLEPCNERDVWEMGECQRKKVYLLLGLQIFHNILASIFTRAGVLWLQKIVLLSNNIFLRPFCDRK